MRDPAPSTQHPRLIGCVLACALIFASLFPATAHAIDVRVGVYDNEPKILLGADGQPSGILGELLQEVARREGWNLIAVPCEWQACLAATGNGQIDLMPDVAFNEQRAQIFDFHATPVLHSWSQLYRRDDANIQSPLDLQGRRVAILKGSVQQDFLAKLLDSFGVKTQWVTVGSLTEGFERTARGEADAVVANHQFGSFHAPKFKLLETPIMFQPSQLFYATGKGLNAELLAALDRRLKDWQSRPDSVYFSTLERWGSALPRTLIPRVFWWWLGAMAGALLLALGGANWLRREVKLKTRHLRESEEKLNTILNSVDAHIYIKDMDLRYLYANRKVAELFGCSPDEVIGHVDADFFDGKTARTLRENDEKVLLKGERLTVEEVNASGDGQTQHTYLSVKLPLRRPDNSIYALCGISTDITEHKKIREEIHQLAFYDPLTQLPNRRLLLSRLSQTLAEHARNAHDGALLFVDLDDFKTLNDTWGHDVGDQLLLQVAQRLGSCTRENDTLARLGGDEFVLLLNGLSPEPAEAAQQAEAVAHKILTTLAQPYALGAHQYQNTVSIGITMFSDPHSTQEELLKRADMAMYRAKADGRNTLCFFNPEMQAQVLARAALEADLREGLKLGHFLLHYQPQADDQGRLLGAEALVRWQHPARGLVMPGEFIPVAEASGLILPMGRWILQAACQQLVAWSLQGAMAHLTLAVNVSVRQFRHADFVKDVLAVLDETGAPAHRLELELTETQLVEDVEGVVAKMSAIKARGVRFSLDDFGTGYSSLSYLKRLPLDKLKIDQSFVRDLLSDPDDAAIVRTIVALGDSLELKVIAEGVETIEQRDALARAGCHLFQGYLLGRPAPAAALLTWAPPTQAATAN